MLKACETCGYPCAVGLCGAKRCVGQLEEMAFLEGHRKLGTLRKRARSLRARYEALYGTCQGKGVRAHRLSLKAWNHAACAVSRLEAELVRVYAQRRAAAEPVAVAS